MSVREGGGRNVCLHTISNDCERAEFTQRSRYQRMNFVRRLKLPLLCEPRNYDVIFVDE